MLLRLALYLCFFFQPSNDVPKCGFLCIYPVRILDSGTWYLSSPWENYKPDSLQPHSLSFSLSGTQIPCMSDFSTVFHMSLMLFIEFLFFVFPFRILIWIFPTDLFCNFLIPTSASNVLLFLGRRRWGGESWSDINNSIIVGDIVKSWKIPWSF